MVAGKTWECCHLVVSCEQHYAIESNNPMVPVKAFVREWVERHSVVSSNPPSSNQVPRTVTNGLPAGDFIDRVSQHIEKASSVRNGIRVSQ